MEYLADAVSAVLRTTGDAALHCWITLPIFAAERQAHTQRLVEAFLSDTNQSACVCATDPTHHDAGITMPAILNDGYIDIDDIAVLQHLLSEVFVTDDIVDRRKSGKPEIQQDD